MYISSLLLWLLLLFRGDGVYHNSYLRAPICVECRRCSNARRTFQAPAVPYRAWCRRQLQRRFDAAPDGARLQLEALLRGVGGGCWERLWADGRIDVEPELGCEPRFVLYPPPAARDRGTFNRLS